MAESGGEGTAARTAGQAQEAAEERPGGMGLFQLLAQAALMYYLWTNVWGSKTKATPNAVPGSSVPDFEAPKPTSLPKPAAQPMSFMGVKMGMEVHPELEDFHQMRRLELSQVRLRAESSWPFSAAGATAQCIHELRFHATPY